MLASFASRIFSHDATNTKNTKKISSYDHQIPLSPCRILCLPLTQKVIPKTTIASTHFLRSLPTHIILMAIQNDGNNVLKKLQQLASFSKTTIKVPPSLSPEKKVKGSYSTLLLVTPWRTATVTTTISSGTNVRIIVFLFVARLYVPIPLFLCSHVCS